VSQPHYSGFSDPELVERCSRHDPEALSEFLRRFRRPMALAIVRTIRHAGPLAPAILDDLLQDTYVRLCANDFALLRTLVSTNPDSFEAMLRVVAANAAHDHLRARMSQKRGGRFHQVPESDSSPIDPIGAEGSAMRIEREAQLDEIDRLLERSIDSPTASRDRRVFWLHFRLGMSSESISQIRSVGLTAKGVESSIFRTLQYLRKAFRIKPR
jgi:RNA polymerase sigma-70 factor, ECF subfamily